MSSLSILIVEDELIVAENLAMLLRRNGYQVVGIAISGEKALEMVEKHQPNVILMDILLRGNLTGIETAHLIREKYEPIIIYQTAFSDLKTREQALLPSNCFYITKPFRFPELQAILKQINNETN
jgi:CheY-like chemotaxis protein